MPRALWTPQAERELDEVLYQIAVRDGRPATGERIYLEIRNLVDSYAPPDAIRRVHPDAPTGWFYVLYKRWLIFYQIHPKGIEVMRIVDGSRDLPAILG